VDGPRAFYYEGRDGWVRLVSQREFLLLKRAGEVNESTRVRYDEGDSERPANEHPATASIFNPDIGVTDDIVDPMTKLEDQLRALEAAKRQAEETAAKARKDAEASNQTAAAEGQRSQAQINELKLKNEQLKQAQADRDRLINMADQLKAQLEDQKRAAADQARKAAAAAAAAVQWAKPVRIKKKGRPVTALLIFVGVIALSWFALQRGVGFLDTAGGGWRDAYAAADQPLRRQAQAGADARGSASRGDSLSVRQSPDAPAGSGWVEVRTRSGAQGFVPAGLVRDTAPPRLDQLVGEMREVAANGVNVRLEPNLDEAHVAGSANRGMRVFVVGTINATQPDNIRWAEILMGDQTVRYISASRLRALPNQPDANAAPAARTRASTRPTPSSSPANAEPTARPPADPAAVPTPASDKEIKLENPPSDLAGGAFDTASPAATAPTQLPAVTDALWDRLPSERAMVAAYPAAARRRTGQAMIACLATSEMRLSRCSVVSESPAGLGFGAAALRLAPDFRLQPRSRSGQMVAGRTVHVPIAFRPQG
jgi:protein TonB